MAIFSKQKLDSIEAREKLETPRHTVMIVDDKDPNLSVMTAILRPHYHLLEARDGQEALALIESMEDTSSLACIVSDHRMPRLNGVDLFERAQPLLPHTLRIIVSGFIDVDAIVDSINKAEVYRFVVKPFDADDFLATVNGAVKTFERQRERAESYAKLVEENQALRAKIEQLEKR
ncbi:MAG TPA: response regulator [Paucimonas sp.]|nr:response regulator [Paucimonas sp.]